MGTRKGQKHYPESLKLQVLEEFNQGKSMTSLSQRYENVKRKHAKHTAIAVFRYGYCVNLGL